MLTEVPAYKEDAGRFLATASSGALGQTEAMGGRRRFKRNSEVYGANEAAEYFYQVISGMARAYKVTVDGRRHVAAFYVPGDVFGLETADQHVFSGETVIDSEILVIKRSVVISLATRDAEMAKHLWLLTGIELRRTQHHMMLLNKSAQERVASFLLELAERIPSEREIRLSMPRQDMADYLGLSIETISRILTRFESTAAIDLPTCRRVVLRNRPALRRMLA
jgi:CRP/FNR family nitrogen fixation transcriptional regulator